MPALNFKSEFADAVESGLKTNTIQSKRKRPIRAGERLILYTGMRTRECRRLGEGECTNTVSIEISEASVVVNGRTLGAEKEYELARFDGFETEAEFRAFFRAEYGLPCSGVLISWSLQEAAVIVEGGKI